MMDRTLVFGYVGKPSRPAMHRVVEVVGRQAGVRISVKVSSSYEELGFAVQTREVDLAWIPPIAFIAAERHRLVVPLVSPARNGGSEGTSSLSFTAVIVVPKRSFAIGLRNLAGCRAAWVDRYSASGYVLPRVELDGAGVDLNGFASETFHGSHLEVVRAVATGAADFGGTFATFGARGEIVRSAWRGLPDLEPRVRVLARVGVPPAEVIGARADMPSALQTQLTRAFVAASRDPENRAMLHAAFGADELKPWKPPGYDLLRTETERASLAGII